ncbi:MAG: ferredoxin [Planctomycetia bacterium]|nr:ferredoxin [Planctomycetia bacterium]
MKKPVVLFEESCVKCAICTEEAPEVFVFVEKIGPQVKEGVDIASHSEKIKKVAQFCPMECIKYHL